MPVAAGARDAATKHPFHADIGALLSSVNLENAVSSHIMLPRRLTARLSGTTAPSPTLVRPFSSTRCFQKSPALSDIRPDDGHVFDAKQQEFRNNLAETQRKKKEQESQSAQSQSASEAAKSRSSVTEYLDAAGMGSLSLSAGETQRKLDDGGKKKSSGRISSLIYGTEEGREMDREIERSFSQVLARGKYVHSIVFHEVKPDKVDEYVELVGSWYPKMANMPENKVHLVGSWRTEVGDCDTFGAYPGARYQFAVTRH